MIASEHHIIDNIHIADKAHTEPVFGNKGKPNAELADLSGRFIAKILGFTGFRVIIELFRRCFKILKAGNSLKQFALTAARNTRNA